MSNMSGASSSQAKLDNTISAIVTGRNNGAGDRQYNRGVTLPSGRGHPPPPRVKTNPAVDPRNSRLTYPPGWFYWGRRGGGGLAFATQTMLSL